MLLLGTLCLTVLLAQPAGLVNPSFEQDTDADGAADGWQTSGHGAVVQRLRRERGPDGGWCQVLDCTSFTGSGPSHHAMLCQTGTLALTRGQWYRLSLKLRGERLAAGAVQIAISDTREWANCGLQTSAMVTDAWLPCEVYFQANRTASEHLRFQIWWASTGAVWFDDLVLETSEPPRGLYAERVPPTTARNLVPNSGFEAGPGGWGSYADVPGWGGNLNQLLGSVVADRPHSGRACLAIGLTPDTTPTYWFDYFDLVQQPITRPLAANRGWFSLEPGRRYVASAWVRAEPPGLEAVLRFRQARGGRPERRAKVTAEWQRLELPFAAAADQGYLLVGPDFAASGVTAGTLFVDDVMLEEGTAPGAYAPRAALEVAVRPARYGGLFEPGETPAGIATLSRETTATPFPAIRYWATDWDDRKVGEWQVEAPPGALTTCELALPLSGCQRGFYRLHVAAEGAEITPFRPLRLAVVPANARDDTILGMNHGYPTDDLNVLSRRSGLGWFRDWSYKWHEVEPQQDKFSFGGADAQVDRLRALGLQVMVLLPFPSSLWSSSGPPPRDQSYESRREQVAHAPKDPADLADYVRRTAAHTRQRITAYEIFNEPVYTSYSLPRKLGYGVKDYVRYLTVAAGALREAHPEATIIGGMQCAPNELMLEFVREGGLEPIDAVSIHHYPSLARPETLLPGLEALRAAMAAAGRPTMPIYWTEGAYYADDDLPRLPYSGDWLTQLPSEKLAASFTIRLNAILCGSNTRRIIYHSGTPGEINHESLAGIFFEYDGLPRKMLPAVATFNELLGPDFTTAGRLAAPAEVYAWRFASGGRSVVIAWSLAAPQQLVLPAGWRAVDIVGRPVTRPRLDGEPLYLLHDQADAVLDLGL